MGNAHPTTRSDFEGLSRELLLLSLYQQKAFGKLADEYAKLICEILHLRLILDSLARDFNEVRSHVGQLVHKKRSGKSHGSTVQHAVELMCKGEASCSKE